MMNIRDKQLAALLKKYLWLIVIYCFAAGSSRFANGGLGGTGANQRSMGVGTNYSLPH